MCRWELLFIKAVNAATKPEVLCDENMTLNFAIALPVPLGNFVYSDEISDLERYSMYRSIV